MKRLRISILTAACLITPQVNSQETKFIDLLKDPDSFEHVLARNHSLTLERDKAFEIDPDKNFLRVTGLGWGYLRTKEEFSDFHLVADFKWGERTHGARADKARDCGIFVHINGRDAAVAGSWPAGVEVQLLESVSGNVAELQPDDRKKTTNVAWDEAWQDQRGWHTQNEPVESKFGHWNRIEIICEGKSMTVKLNGQLVNKVDDLDPAAGKIGIQSELAECIFRRLEVYPLGKFKEEWQPEAKSNNTGYTATGDSIVPREFPLGVEESLNSWHIDGNYELQVVAAEPLIVDPVDVVWDQHGKMYVAEMRDYPLPSDYGGYLSRIRILSDTDGDGRMDEATTWADELDHVQGLLPMNGGILATTRTELLFLRDTTGDGVADERKTLFKSNEPRHNQLQISCPRWGVDNMIYLNNGLDLKEIYPVDQPDNKLSISRANIRLNPHTMELEPVSGYGQFGATQDDWGRRFSCSNRNPTMFAVMPLWAVQRNPFDHLSQGHEDIAPAGGDAKVYPFELSHTTSIAHAGTHTAACGLGVYRGHLMPEMTGNMFVCEPTAQLITRSHLKPAGGNLIAERVGDKRDFLVSSDEWSRPVNVRNGPDGAFYICDMYRRFIDHARFFPEEFSKSHYMRAGVDQGRIYRLVPKGHQASAIEPLADDSTELAALLGSKNAWQRIHAQRLILEQKPEGIEQIVRQVFENTELPQGRVHAMNTLAGLGKLTPEDVSRALADPNPAVVENAIPHSNPKDHRDEIYQIAQEGTDRARFWALLELGYDPSPETTELFQKVLHNLGGNRDRWIRNAVLSGSEERAGTILSYVLENPITIETGVGPGTADVAAMIREFSTAVAARGNGAEIAGVLNSLKKVETTEFKFAVAQGFSDGLKKSKLKTKTLAAFIASPPTEAADAIEDLKAIVSSAEAIVVDADRSLSERVAAIPLASQQVFEKFRPIAEELIKPTTPPELSAAAMKSMSRFKRDDLAEFFYARWEKLSLATRREAVALLASGATLIPLMEKMKAGEINPRLMDPIKSWSYARSTNEAIKKLALELYGSPNDDRSKVIAEYKAALETDREPDLENGKAILTKAACITCHRVGDVGVAVGPDLADVKVKPAVALLTDILDPNRMIEERWVSHTVTATDGNVYSGIITGDDNTNLSIKLPGGVVQTIRRDQVDKIESTGMSLMPMGLEGVISKEDMVDLIGFLKAR